MHLRLGEALLLIYLLSWPWCSANHRMYRCLSASYHTRTMHICVLLRHCRLGYNYGMFFFKFDSMYMCDQFTEGLFPFLFTEHVVLHRRKGLHNTAGRHSQTNGLISFAMGCPGIRGRN